MYSANCPNIRLEYSKFCSLRLLTIHAFYMGCFHESIIIIILSLIFWIEMKSFSSDQFIFGIFWFKGKLHNLNFQHNFYLSFLDKMGSRVKRWNTLNRMKLQLSFSLLIVHLILLKYDYHLYLKKNWSWTYFSLSSFSSLSLPHFLPTFHVMFSVQHRRPNDRNFD